MNCCCCAQRIPGKLQSSQQQREDVGFAFSGEKPKRHRRFRLKGTYIYRAGTSCMCHVVPANYRSYPWLYQPQLQAGVGQHTAGQPQLATWGLTKALNPMYVSCPAPGLAFVGHNLLLTLRLSPIR